MRGMGQEWDQNGARMGQEWDKNGTRMGQEWGKNGARMGQEWDKNGTRMSYLLEQEQSCPTHLLGIWQVVWQQIEGEDPREVSSKGMSYKYQNLYTLPFCRIGRKEPFLGLKCRSFHSSNVLESTIDELW